MVKDNENWLLALKNSPLPLDLTGKLFLVRGKKRG
jgi:hypothetical protein